MKKTLAVLILLSAGLVALLLLVIPTDTYMEHVLNRSDTPQRNLDRYLRQAEREGMTLQLADEIIHLASALEHGHIVQSTIQEVLEMHSDNGNAQKLIYRHLEREGLLINLPGYYENYWQEDTIDEILYEVLKVYAFQEEYDKQLEVLQLLRERDPYNEEILQMISQIHSMKGEYEQQLEVVRILWEQYPQEPEYWKAMTDLLMQTGRQEELVRILNDKYNSEEPLTDWELDYLIGFKWAELSRPEKFEMSRLLYEQNEISGEKWLRELFNESLIEGDFDMARNTMVFFDNEPDDSIRLWKGYIWHQKFEEAEELGAVLFDKMDTEDQVLFLNLLVWMNKLPEKMPYVLQMEQDDIPHSILDILVSGSRQMADTRSLEELLYDMHEPGDPDGYLKSAALLAFKRGDLDKAVEYLYYSIEESGTVTEDDRQIMTYILEHAGEIDHIVAFHEKYLIEGKFEDPAQALRALDYYYHVSQQFEKGRDFLLSWETPPVVKDDAHTMLYKYLRLTGDWNRLSDYLMASLKEEPGEPSEYYLLLQAARWSDDEEAMAFALEELWKIDPEQYFWLCYTEWSEAENTPRIRKLLDELLILNEADKPFLGWYVMIISDLPEEEREERLQVLLDSSTHPDDFLRIGRVMLANGYTVYAAKAFTAVLDERPNDPEALMRMGILRSWENDLDSAREYLERAYYHDPDNYEIMYYLAQARWYQGEKSSAYPLYFKIWDELSAEQDLDITQRLILAKAAGRIGKVTQAREMFTQLQEEFPQDIQIRADFLEMLFDIGAYTEAYDIYQSDKMVRESKNLRIRRMYVRLLLRMGDTVAAMNELSVLIKEYPDEAGLWTDKGYAFSGLGMNLRAMSAFQRSMSIRTNQDISRSWRTLYRQTGNYVATTWEQTHKSDGEDRYSPGMEFMVNLNKASRMGGSFNYITLSGGGADISESSAYGQLFYEHDLDLSRTTRITAYGSSVGPGAGLSYTEKIVDGEWGVSLFGRVPYMEYPSSVRDNAYWHGIGAAWEKTWDQVWRLSTQVFWKSWGGDEQESIKGTEVDLSLTRQLPWGRSVYGTYSWSGAYRDDSGTEYWLSEKQNRHSLGVYTNYQWTRSSRSWLSTGYSYDFHFNHGGVYAGTGIEYLPSDANVLHAGVNYSKDHGTRDNIGVWRFTLGWKRYF